MKLIKWIVAISFALSIGYLVNYFALDSDLYWTKSVYQKKINILRDFKEQKRIILIGGSGTHYGIDALQMEKKLNIPVVNMGLHGGLGRTAILASIDNDINPGDVVFLTLEYGLLEDEQTGWLSPAFGVAIGRLGIGVRGSLKQKVVEIIRGCTQSLTSFGKAIMKILFQAKGRSYDIVDARGDAVIYVTGLAAPCAVNSLVSNKAKIRLKEFNEELRNKGAKLIIGLPWVLVSKDDRGSNNHVSKMITELKEIAPVLYNVKTLNLYYDPKLFSDTYLHNNKEGRIIRTQELTDNIRDYL